MKWTDKLVVSDRGHFLPKSWRKFGFFFNFSPLVRNKLNQLSGAVVSSKVFRLKKC
jgi:hypothetical protein